MSETLAELFARDPFKCTRQHIEQIVAIYREKHKQVAAGIMSAGKAKPITGKAAITHKAVSGDGLDI